jgi:tRNA threonylcarbamoyladenosine biosynthesis protein TsaE
MESFLKKKFSFYRKHLSTGPEKTTAIAMAFAKLLKRGDVIGLLGGLGAGKTSFVKGSAKFLGFKPADIVSPTFNLVKEHKKPGISVYHFDLYRLEKPSELDKIGYREYITDESAVALIEWPDRIKETWKDYDWVVEILHKEKNERQIVIYKKKSKVISQKSKGRQVGKT